jgi:hypothetical protein
MVANRTTLRQSRTEADVAEFDRPLDLVHLARMTLGDRSLEREVLQLFMQQSCMLVQRMQAVRSEAALAPLAHALQGSAKGIGAWRVAACAEAVERITPDEATRLAGAVDRLADAVLEARDIIEDLLNTA